MINLTSFPYFKEKASLKKLNRHVRLHRDFMMHQLASATGCSLPDAMGIILLLYAKQLGDIQVAIYHKDDLSTPMFVKRAEEGPPKIPFINPLNESEIGSREELAYDFILKLHSGIEIMFNHVSHDDSK